VEALAVLLLLLLVLLVGSLVADKAGAVESCL
jgi:hypothetical protein